MVCFPITVRESIAHEMRLSVIREPHVWKFDKLINKIEVMVSHEFSTDQRAALNQLFVENLHRTPHITSSYPEVVDRIETIVLRWDVYDRECEIIELKRNIGKLKRENANLRNMLLNN